MKAIGIDIGTTSVCGVLLDSETGKAVKSITKNSGAFIDTPNTWEKIQSVERIMSVADGILESLVTPDTAVIGVTGQMHGIVYTDENGKAISPLYTWQDERGNLPYRDSGKTYAETLGSFAGYGNVTDFYNAENGIRPPQAVSRCTIHDYFVMRLCGLAKPVMHTSDAASLGLFDLGRCAFSCELDAEVTPDYRIAGVCGKYGIPVSVAVGDNQASVFSTLADERDVLVNVGTGSQVSVVSERPSESREIESRPYFEGKYLLVGAALCGGRAYSVLKNFYSEVFGYREKLGDNEVYGIMNDMLRDVKDALAVDTRFAGTRRDSSVTGGIYGITTENFTPSALTRGVLCGMANELFDMYAGMGVTKTGLVGSGNGIRKNKALVGIFEEKFGAKMKIPAHLEEAAFGAAIFGLVAQGTFKNAREAQKTINYQRD